MRLAVHVAQNAHIQFWSELLNDRDPLEDLCSAGSVILKWILKKQGVIYHYCFPVTSPKTEAI
jgi:hypothetical protein